MSKRRRNYRRRSPYTRTNLGVMPSHRYDFELSKSRRISKPRKLSVSIRKYPNIKNMLERYKKIEHKRYLQKQGWNSKNISTREKLEARRNYESDWQSYYDSIF